MHINKFDYYKRLTPQMRDVVDYVKKWNAEHPATADYRQDYLDERIFWNEGGPTPAKVVESTVEGPNGPIPVRLHYPTVSDKPMGVTIYFHGGSLMLGNNDTHSRVMRMFAEESNTVVIGVDYRLAPEYKFPSWIDEGVAVVRHFHQHGAEFNLDPNDIALCGDSAGAYMSLSIALYLRDHDKDISYLRSLILYYGIYGMRDSKSFRQWGNDVDAIMREDSTTLYSTSTLASEQDAFSPYYDLLASDLTHDIPP
ncbi:MAG: alpha/beta hydrolase fold domain-containing protein, partial [Pseudoflavonifractor sp.]